MKKKLGIQGIVLFSIGLVLSACGSTTPARMSSAISLTDGLGRQVNLASPAQKILSLTPSNTEMLFAVKANSQVIGRDEFSDYPLEAKNLPSVGGSMGNYDLERIASLQPDLILAEVGMNTPEQVQSMEKLGLTVYCVADPIQFEDLYANIQFIGKLTGHEQDASLLVSSLKVRADAVTTSIAKTTERPLVYYELDASDPSKPWTFGPGSFISALIHLAGGKSIGETLTSLYAQISLETLLIQNPDIILVREGIGSATPADIAQRDGWESINAVQQNHIYTIDANIITRPGPRLVDGLETIARLLHPEVFQ
jgi:iron complex transport system substrate-binding protein